VFHFLLFLRVYFTLHIFSAFTHNYFYKLEFHSFRILGGIEVHVIQAERKGGRVTNMSQKYLKFRILGGMEVHVIQAEREGGRVTNMSQKNLNLGY